MPAKRALWKDYVALTKPRIISLLLFTTLAAMYIAAGRTGVISLPLFCAVAIGGYLAAGAANALNMVIDRDIDGRMERTSTRPTVTREISTGNALRFACLIDAISIALLWRFGGILCALLAQAGLAFYVVVYTLLLKRRTWHNIVIGGAAGAFPPLVGWTAVTHSLSPLAWTLFALIFVWTPMHFWALALLIKDDYAKANVPMLPVVRGDRATVVQIQFYTALTVALSFLPVARHEAGAVYLVACALLNAPLIVYSVKLLREVSRPNALHLFKYSMLYLALIFLLMAIDRAA